MKQSPEAAWKALAAMAPEAIEEEKERNDRPEEEHRWADLEKTLPEEKESIISQRGGVCMMGRGRGAEELRARPWEEVDKAGSTTKSAAKRRLLSATGLTLAVVLLKAMVLRVFAGEGRPQRGLPIRWHAGETMAVAETWEGAKRAIEAYTGLSLAIFFTVLVVVAAAFYYAVFGFPAPPAPLLLQTRKISEVFPDPARSLDQAASFFEGEERKEARQAKGGGRDFRQLPRADGWAATETLHPCWQRQAALPTTNPEAAAQHDPRAREEVARCVSSMGARQIMQPSQLPSLTKGSEEHKLEKLLELLASIGEVEEHEPGKLTDSESTLEFDDERETTSQTHSPGASRQSNRISTVRSMNARARVRLDSTCFSWAKQRVADADLEGFVYHSEWQVGVEGK